MLNNNDNDDDDDDNDDDDTLLLFVMSCREEVWVLLDTKWPMLCGVRIKGLLS